MTGHTVTFGTFDFRSTVRDWQFTGQLRAIVPEHTTSEPPKLQCLWLDKMTGETEWRSIPREVVSAQEFFAA